MASELDKSVEIPPSLAEKSSGGLGVLSGTEDVLVGLRQIDLPIYLAKADIKQRYRRSTLGPFWITISTGVMIMALGYIFGSIYKSAFSVFFPFLASGMIIWAFISSTIRGATQVFTGASALITQLSLPLFVHVLRLLVRNFYILLHNLVILPIVFIIVKAGIGFNLLFIIPGFILLVINLLWIALAAGIVCTRYRDLTPIVESILQVCFYITPIMWMPSMMKARVGEVIMNLNPFFHMLEVVRSPLLNQCPTLLNWSVSLGLAIFGWMATLILFNKYKKRIAYWL